MPTQMTVKVAFTIGILCTASVVAVLLLFGGGGGATTITTGTTATTRTSSTTAGCSALTCTSSSTADSTMTTTTSTPTSTAQSSISRTTASTTTSTASCCSSQPKRLGFWVDERDMWSGVGLSWNATQFVSNYFEEPPYPAAMLFATALTPTGAGAPTATGEAQWLGQVASLAKDDGLDVEIVILFFVNLSGQTIGGVPDQTSSLTQYMLALGPHPNIYGAEYEVEYFGNSQSEEQSFFNIVTGAGYVDVLNPGTVPFYSGEPVLDYSTFPYFGGSIPATTSATSIGVGYGETGVPSGSTPNPAWTQTTVQAIVDRSPGDPFVFMYAGSGGTGQPAFQLWDWSTLQQWIWSDSNYRTNYILSQS